MAMRYYILLLTLILYKFGGNSATSDNSTVSTTPIPKETPPTKLRKSAKYTSEEKYSGITYMSEVGSRCADDGFYADRDDCRKFHVCYGGTQSVRWCKEGMLWDETKIGCGLQSLTPCVGGRKKWGYDEITTTMPTTTATATASAALNFQLHKGNYTCRPGATGFFADPSSCSIYHWCVLGVLQSTHRCNSGLHFSPSANGCLWPKDAECEGQIAPPYSPIECALGHSGYFPDPYDCSVFHYCDGVKTQSDALLCSSGLIWSSRLESCAWPHEVTECQNSCPPTYSSQMRFADPVTCSQYAQCVDGHLEQRTCSNKLLFDRITKTCKPFEQAECHGAKPDSLTGTPSTLSAAKTTTTTATTSSSSPTISDVLSGSSGSFEFIKKQRSIRFVCVADGYFGDVNDCRIYHVCVDGRDYRSMCAPGLAWEPLLRLCMSAHVVGCQSSKSFEPPAASSNRRWFHLLTRPAVKTTTTIATTMSTTSATPFALPSIFTCAGRPNGYFADPVHCHKFHYCATGWHSVMECDEGLAYSARENDCVPVEYADCGKNRLMSKRY